MSIERIDSGLLLHDDFGRSDGGIGDGWTTPLGSWEIVSGEVRETGAATAAYALADATAGREEILVQAVLARESLSAKRPWLIVRRPADGDPNSHLQVGLSENGSTKRLILFRMVNGFASARASADFAYTDGAAYTIQFHSAAGVQRVYVDGQMLLSATDTVLNGLNEYAGLRTSGSGASPRFDDFVACSATVVSCRTLPLGYKLRIAGREGLRDAEGIARVDLLGVVLPAPQVEVLDESGVLVESFSPPDGVWGGDRFEYGHSAGEARVTQNGAELLRYGFADGETRITLSGAEALSRGSHTGAARVTTSGVEVVGFGTRAGASRVSLAGIEIIGGAVAEPPAHCGLYLTEDLRVAVPLSFVPASGIARVEYAVSSTAPGAEAWSLLGESSLEETLATDPLPPGSTVWIRMRSRQPNRAPSAWTEPESLTL